MPGGLVALLDDVAAIARVAAASLDDISVAASKAGTKAAGVVIDDAVVVAAVHLGVEVVGQVVLGDLGPAHVDRVAHVLHLKQEEGSMTDELR